MKKTKIVGVFISMILSVILHYLYEWFPNSITSLIAPVNESVWEHMKLIVSANLLFGIMEYIILKKKKIEYNNLLLAYAITSVLGVILYLLFYIPLNDFFGYKGYITVILLFIIFTIMGIINYYLLKKNKITCGKEIGILLIIVTYYVFGYFTYHPPKLNLFYDYMYKGYGIIKNKNE